MTAGIPGECEDHDVQWPEQAGRLRGDATGISTGPTGHRNEAGEIAGGYGSATSVGASMKEVLRKEVEGLRHKSSYVQGSNPSGLTDVGEPKRRVGFVDGDEFFGGGQVPSSNPPGLSGHNRHGGPCYNIQHVSSTSGPNIVQHASSASGPLGWNVLGMGAGTAQPTEPLKIPTKETRASPMEALLKNVATTRGDGISGWPAGQPLRGDTPRSIGERAAETS